MRFNFQKLLDGIGLLCCMIVSFPEVVRDNVVSNDVTITSSLCSDVIILGINVIFS